MPPRERRDQSETEHEHPLVSRVVGPPQDVPSGSTMLTGYLGRSTNSGCQRLYRSEAFDDFVEIPSDAILAVDSPPDDGQNRVWVRAGTKLTRTQVSANTVAAEMLSGAITTQLQQVAAQSFVAGMRYGRSRTASRWPSVTNADNCTWAQTHCPGCWPNHGTEVGFGCNDSDFPCTDSWACD